MAFKNVSSLVLVTVISAMHLRIFKNTNVYFNPFAFRFVKSSGKIKYRYNMLRKTGKYT